MDKNEFRRFAHGHLGISSLKLDTFESLHSVGAGCGERASRRASQALAVPFSAPAPTGAAGTADGGYISPTIIEERQLNVATMDVFSRLMMDRIIFLGVPIYDDAANIIQAQLLFLEATDHDRDIQLYINSPGGSVTAGLGIYDTMQLLGPDVATICTGLAASMSAVLLAAGAPTKRSALTHSRIMIHQPLGGVQGQASDIEITAKQILQTRQELFQILAEHSKQNVKKIAEDADRDYWMTSKEAMDYGLIDRIMIKRDK